jgi:hypothetical protein
VPENPKVPVQFLAFGTGRPHTTLDSGLTQQDPLSAPVGSLGTVPVQALDGMSLATLDSFYAYAPNYFGGVWVAGSR